MSWLYTIVFAGLVVSSDLSDPAKDSCQLPVAQPAAVEAVQGDERERFEQSYPISPNGRVNVSNVNGSITVEAWDRNEVRLEAVKIADTREALAEVQLKIDARPDSFSVEADHDAWRRGAVSQGWKNHGRLEVQFKLSVPRTAVLNDIETVNGSVIVSNFVNVTKVSAVNGNVNATNLRGTAQLSTVNGMVMADFDRLEPGSKISLDTVNGGVSLMIPSDASATLKADSLNGEIRNDFGLPVRKGKYVGRDMYGRVGNGDAQVKLESVNGPLTVKRKSDGRSLSPATNLLPQKAKDEEDDWDTDTVSRSRNSKINKEIEKSIRDAARATADGMNIAHAELARIAPEIEKIKSDSLKSIKPIEPKDVKQSVNNAISTRPARATSRTSNIRWAGGADFIEKKSATFGVKGVAKVSVEAKGCSVKVRGWDRPEVKYVLTEMEGKGRRMPASVTANVNDSTVALKVDNNERASRDIYFNGDTDSVRIEVFVPNKSNLKVISNGEIRLDGVSGEIELNGVDEAIDVRNVEGKLKVSAVDGLVRVIGFNGEIDSKVGDGDVYLEGTFSRITGTARDGNFILTLPEQQNAEIVANVESLELENLPEPETVREGVWRFGTGGPKYSFTVADGEVRVRSSNTLTSTR